MKLYETTAALLEDLDGHPMVDVALQGLDLTSIETEISQIQWHECIFLGCEMSPQLRCHLQEGNYLFPRLNVPFKTYPDALYTGASLYQGYDPQAPQSYLQSYDKLAYDYHKSSASSPSLKSTLAETLHDHSITEHLHHFLSGTPSHRIVAIMGGHGLPRTDGMYRQIALLSKHLTEQGFLMLSGGGPGAMEATHLGAWLAGRADTTIDTALGLLHTAPHYDSLGWLETAFEVMSRYPTPKYVSLGIPTWHYGHELATPLATHIAKYFANSIREEGLLALAKGGVIYTPGSAGTMQEIFQDLAQNHYISYEMSSPMIFLGREYWTQSRPIYPLLEQMNASGKLNSILLSLTDDNTDVIDTLRAFSDERKRISTSRNLEE